MNKLNLTNQKFGRWQVLGEAGKNKRGNFTWRCKCECGNVGVIVGALLKIGHSKSCGCLRSEVTTRRSTKHGCAIAGKDTREYLTWCDMKKRCNNPNHSHYHHYGGRGIKVCDQWLSSFPAFLADMGLRPSPTHSIDRINNDGNYEPSNCRWATMQEQRNNKSTSRNLIYQGAKYSVSALERHLGVAAGTLKYRLHAGWTVDEATGIPIRKVAA